MIDAALVGAGGVLGAVARYLVGQRLSGRRATASVNVLGSALLGLVVTLPVGDSVLLAVGTGFCGAFTTFSSFAVEVADLSTDGAERVAGQYALLMLVGALLGVGVGTLVGRGLG
ncbi:fluoride efflux transporter FluC [Salinirubrum litoreum]|uniref:Fluoride-specific ion channel FluC n=1 Tax=Salinirubrum litoreum TaxID=1126234 RepID=A0ABD5RDK9_9EURY